MHKILITGGSGSGKTILAYGLMKEYKSRGFTSCCIEDIQKADDIDAQIEGFFASSKSDEFDESQVDFCILTSLESPEELGGDFFRVIRTGRS